MLLTKNLLKEVAERGGAELYEIPVKILTTKKGREELSLVLFKTLRKINPEGGEAPPIDLLQGLAKATAEVPGKLSVATSFAGSQEATKPFYEAQAELIAAWVSGSARDGSSPSDDAWGAALATQTLTKMVAQTLCNELEEMRNKVNESFADFNRGEK